MGEENQISHEPGGRGAQLNLNDCTAEEVTGSESQSGGERVDGVVEMGSVMQGDELVRVVEMGFEMGHDRGEAVMENAGAVADGSHRGLHHAEEEDLDEEGCGYAYLRSHDLSPYPEVAEVASSPSASFLLPFPFSACLLLFVANDPVPSFLPPISPSAAASFPAPLLFAVPFPLSLPSFASCFLPASPCQMLLPRYNRYVFQRL